MVLRIVAIAALAVSLATACSSDESAPAAVETTAFELTESTMPVLRPGGSAAGTITLAGRTIEYVTVTPANFTVGSVAPVLLALPPGGQDLGITANVANAVYLDQARRRGWVVVTPASPGGLWFDDGNVALIPELVSWMAAWAPPEGGRPHLGGMSNGGISAFRIASEHPDLFRSVLAYPGFPNDSGDRERLADLSALPVRMWVGGADTEWVSAMETTRDGLFTAGVDVELTIFPGEPHVIRSTSNGVIIFDELDSLRRG